MIKDSLKPRPTEVEVNYSGQKVWLGLSNKNLTPNDILWIQKEHGYNAACWVLYKFFKEKASAAEFFKFIDANKTNYSQSYSDYTVIVLAHNPWASRARNEDYQWRLKNIAVDMGFGVFTPEIGYRRSLFANAYAYQEMLKRFDHKTSDGRAKKIIFLTYGVASLELKWMLQKSQSVPENIIGWMNISGLLYGTALPPTNSRLTKAILDFSGGFPINPDVLRSNIYCKQPFTPQMPLVSVLGIQPESRFTLKDRFTNEDIKHWGPHDNYSSLVDYMQAPGVVWPLWGESHSIDVEIYKNRLQAALRYILQQQGIVQPSPTASGDSQFELDI